MPRHGHRHGLRHGHRHRTHAAGHHGAGVGHHHGHHLGHTRTTHHQWHVGGAGQSQVSTLGMAESQLAGSARQTQGDLEDRMVRLKAHSAESGPNPLIEHFATDPVVQALDIDIKALKTLMSKQFFMSPLCHLPCFWPHSLVILFPCTVCWSIGKIPAAAAAHVVTLRENSIEYRVGEYNAAGIVTESAQACACCVGMAGDLHEVFPLSTITDATVTECQTRVFCGVAPAPNTLTIKVGSEVVIAIDAPVDGDAFCELVMAQAEIARGRGVALPPDVSAAYNKYKVGRAPQLDRRMMSAIISQPGMMAQAQATQPPVSQQPPPSAPPAPDLVAKLQSLVALRDQGVLSDSEFGVAKARLLNDAPPPKYNQVLPV
eukprot:m.30124 g.30124  ORF g.30124 m.30124 type:complete len:374 (+) comp12193_c0_seq1:1192-2313(+)